MNTTDLEERVDALELGLALVEDDVADIETDFIIVEQEVDNLDVDVSIQEERILSVESDVVALENESASTSNLSFGMGGFSQIAGVYKFESASWNLIVPFDSEFL